MPPLAIDLFCGLGGWTEGLLAEGYEVIGFDIERHRYPARALPKTGERKVAMDGVDFNNPNIGSSRNRSFNYANECAVKDAPLIGGWMEYPAQLVIQDVCTLHGSQFKNAALIVASPPCQEYSYMAMPWSLAKAKAKAIRADTTGEKLAALNRLFNQCFRIQKEASLAAGRVIPLVVENVKGAQPWVGRARWSFGSFYLWGDIPALMPITMRRRMKSQISCAPRLFSDRVASTPEEAHALHYRLPDGHKNTGGSWFNIGSPGQNETNRNPVHALSAEGIKCGGDWLNDEQPSISRLTSSKSSARKAASAMIAKIPLLLSRHIAATFKEGPR